MTTLLKNSPLLTLISPYFGRIDPKWFCMHSALGYDPNTQEHVVLKIWVHINPKDREEQHYVGTELIELGGHVVLSG
ncbi:hypothetical protein NL676_001438 [Syzygium grande]|nr:hypothetical protein NL676_001438 [Syzygium grande]